MFIAAVVFRVVGEVLKDQTLIQCAEGRRHFSQIVGGPDDESVGLTDGIQHRRQTVFADAVPFELFLLASEAGDAPGVFFQAKQIEPHHLCTGGFGTFRRFGKQRIRIPALSRAGIDNNDLLAHFFLPDRTGSTGRVIMPC